MKNQKIQIRQACLQDFAKIWEIFHQVVQSGDTYAYAPGTRKEEAQTLWMSPEKSVYVATLADDEIVGTYFIKANQPGLGSHVVNAAYMVHPTYQGHGIGKAMALHSFDEAKRLGYTAMQFNFVVSSNTTAVSLWKKMGFNIIGIIPLGFKHATLGYIDAYIMHKFL